MGWCPVNQGVRGEFCFLKMNFPATAVLGMLWGSRAATAPLLWPMSMPGSGVEQAQAPGPARTVAALSPLDLLWCLISVNVA